MNSKDIKKVLSNLFNSSFAGLSQAVKAFTQICKNADTNTVNDIVSGSKLTAKQARSIISFGKDPKRVMNACRVMFAAIDGQFCEYKIIAREYKQDDKRDKSFDKTSELTPNILLGKVYKPYGLNVSPVEIIPNSLGIMVRESLISKTVYAPFKIEIFKVNRIIRAVGDYIAVCDKMGIDWTKTGKGNE